MAMLYRIKPCHPFRASLTQQFDAYTNASLSHSMPGMLYATGHCHMIASSCWAGVSQRSSDLSWNSTRPCL